MKMRTLCMVLIVIAVIAAPLSALTPGFGASYDASLFLSSKDNNDYYIGNLKLHGALDFTPDLSLFLRFKLQTANMLNPGDTTLSADKKRAFIDLDQGFFSWSGKELSLTLGRSIFTLGSGVLFDGVADGLELGFDAGTFAFKVFGAYSGFIVSDANPYRFSREDIAEGAKRLFVGASIDLYAGKILGLTAAGLAERDNTDIPESRYNANYLSLLLKGFISPALVATLEGVMEGGTSPDGAGGAAHDIGAKAAIFRLNFAFLDSSESVLRLDLAYGSGSKNRTTYFIGGVEGIGEDEQFFTFGKYSTGFVFTPALANLLYAGLSFAAMPFTAASIFSRSSVTLHTAAYFKEKKEAPISELNTIKPELFDPHAAFLGWAFDASWAWRIVSDISFILAAGVFKPGTVYTDRDLDFLLQTTLVISF